MFRNWGNSNGASKRLGQLVPSRACPAERLDGSAGLQQKSPDRADGWVTHPSGSQEGEKSKKSWIVLRMGNSTSIAQLRRLSCHIYPFLHILEGLKAMKTKGAKAQSCWLALHNPLWLHPASICCVLLFETSLCGPVENVPRDGISLYVCAYSHSHTQAAF